jgi:hypothetical protein
MQGATSQNCFMLVSMFDLSRFMTMGLDKGLCVSSPFRSFQRSRLLGFHHPVRHGDKVAPCNKKGSLPGRHKVCEPSTGKGNQRNRYSFEQLFSSLDTTFDPLDSWTWTQRSTLREPAFFVALEVCCFNTSMVFHGRVE